MSPPFPAETAFLEPLDLDVSENPFQDLRALSLLAEGEYSHFGFVFYKCFHRLRAYLGELQPRTPAADIRNGRRQLVGAHVVSIQGRSVFTVAQANLALSATFDATAAGNPIESVFAPESRSDTVHPCIFSCPNSSVSTNFASFRRRGMLRLCELSSLRLRTRTLTSICSKQFLRFVGLNWMMLALLNWCITSVVKLHLASLPLIPSPAASSSSFLVGIYGLPRNEKSLTLT
jgi:hypothetical protein